MTVTHPLALRDGGAVPGAYTFGTDTHAIDSDGTVDCPDALEAEVAEALADHYGVDVTDIYGPGDGSDGVCGAEMSDGSTCERPADECPYHDDED